MDESRIIVGSVAHGAVIAEAAGASFNPLVDQCIARTVRGELVGGVIYSGYTGASIGLHMAGFTPNWISRDLLWVCFDYPFTQLRCQKIFGQVPETNAQALEMNRKLGFIVEARIKNVFPDGDLLVLSMHRDVCRWLSIKPRHLSRKPGDTDRV